MIHVALCGVIMGSIKNLVTVSVALLPENMVSIVIVFRSSSINRTKSIMKGVIWFKITNLRTKRSARNTRHKNIEFK